MEHNNNNKLSGSAQGKPAQRASKNLVEGMREYAPPHIVDDVTFVDVTPTGLLAEEQLIAREISLTADQQGRDFLQLDFMMETQARRACAAGDLGKTVEVQRQRPKLFDPDSEIDHRNEEPELKLEEFEERLGREVWISDDSEMFSEIPHPPVYRRTQRLPSKRQRRKATQELVLRQPRPPVRHDRRFKYLDLPPLVLARVGGPLVRDDDTDSDLSEESDREEEEDEEEEESDEEEEEEEERGVFDLRRRTRDLEWRGMEGGDLIRAAFVAARFSPYIFEQHRYFLGLLLDEWDFHTQRRLGAFSPHELYDLMLDCADHLYDIGYVRTLRESDQIAVVAFSRLIDEYWGVAYEEDERLQDQGDARNVNRRRRIWFQLARRDDPPLPPAEVRRYPPEREFFAPDRQNRFEYGGDINRFENDETVYFYGTGNGSYNPQVPPEVEFELDLWYTNRELISAMGRLPSFGAQCRVVLLCLLAAAVIPLLCEIDARLFAPWQWYFVGEFRRLNPIFCEWFMNRAFLAKTPWYVHRGVGILITSAGGFFGFLPLGQVMFPVKVAFMWHFLWPIYHEISQIQFESDETVVKTWRQSLAEWRTYFQVRAFLSSAADATRDVAEVLFGESIGPDPVAVSAGIAAGSTAWVAGFGPDMLALFSGELLELVSGINVPHLNTYLLAFNGLMRARDARDVVHELCHIAARETDDQPATKMAPVLVELLAKVGDLSHAFRSESEYVTAMLPGWMGERVEFEGDVEMPDYFTRIFLKKLPDVYLVRSTARLMAYFMIDGSVGNSWPVGKVREVVDSIGLPALKKGAEVALLDELIALLVKFYRVFKDFVKTGDWKVFLQGEPLPRWNSDVQALLVKQRPLALNERPTLRVTKVMQDDEWLNVCEDYLAKGNRMLSGRDGHEDQYTKAGRKLWTELYLKVQECLIENRSLRERVPPIQIAFIGPPGCGKSTIMTSVMRHVLALRGEPNAKVFEIKSELKYFDTLTQNVRAFLIDDGDVLLPDQKASGGWSLSEFIISVGANVRIVFPGAAVEAKNRLTCEPVVVVISSNNDDLGGKGLLKAPDAALRRIRLYFMCELKPEFASSRGVVDPAKIAAYVAEHPEDQNPLVMNMKVRAYKKKNDKGMAGFDDLPLEDVCNITSLDALRELITRETHEHFSSNERAFTMAADAYAYCAQCGTNKGMMAVPCNHAVETALPSGAIALHPDVAFKQMSEYHADMDSCQERPENEFDVRTEHAFMASSTALALYMMAPFLTVSLILASVVVWMVLKIETMLAFFVAACAQNERTLSYSAMLKVKLYLLLNRTLPTRVMARIENHMLRRAVRHREAYVLALGAFTAGLTLWWSRRGRSYAHLEADVGEPRPRGVGGMRYVDPQVMELVPPDTNLPVQPVFKRENKFIGHLGEVQSPYSLAHPAGVHLPDLLQHVATNVFKLSYEMANDSERREGTGTCWRYSGNLCVTNAHAIPPDREKEKFVFRLTQAFSPGLRSDVLINVGQNAFIDRKNDLLVFVAPDIGALAGQGLKRFLMVDNNGRPNVPDDSHLVRVRDRVESARFSVLGLESIFDVPTGLPIGTCWKYTRPEGLSAKGDCGSPAVFTVGTHHFVAGHHQAGSPNYGFVKPVTQALVNPLADKAKKWFTSFETEELTMPRSGEWSHGFQFHDLRPTNPKHNGQHCTAGSVISLGASGFRATPRFNVKVSRLLPYFEGFVRDYGPPGGWAVPIAAPLAVGDTWLEPFSNSWRTQTTGREIVESYVLWGVKDYCDFADDLVFEKWRMLSFQEAVFGDPMHDVGCLDRATSMGPPFSSPKKEFVEDGDQRLVISGLRERTEYILSCLRSSRVVPPIAKSSLKDEKLPLAKAEARQVRVFEVIEAAHNVAGKMLFTPIIWFLASNPIFCETFFAVNFMTRQCDPFLEFVVKDGWPRLEGDISKMDKTVRMVFASGGALAFKIIALKLGYSAENAEAVFQYAVSVTTAIVEANGDLYYVVGRNTSGNSITILINMMLQSLYWRYAFVFAHKGRPPGPFRKFVHLATVGDDSSAAISPEVVGAFNGEVLAEVFRTFGVKLTSSNDKSRPPELLIGDPYPEICSRKARFSRELKRVVFPLNKERLTAFVAIRKKSQLSADDHDYAVANDFLREAFLWGKPFFDEHQHNFRTAFSCLGVRCRDLLSWEEVFAWHVANYLQ